MPKLRRLRHCCEIAGRRLAGLARADRGTAVIEFALICAPFIALLLGTAEVALLFFAQQGLQTAAEVAARTITTGQVQSVNTTAAQFKTIACNALPAFLTCDNLMVDVETATSFSSISNTNPVITFDKNGNVTNTWAYTPGVGGSIVILRLMYIWSLPTGPMNFNLANISNGQHLIVSTAVFKSENYQ